MKLLYFIFFTLCFSIFSLFFVPTKNSLLIKQFSLGSAGLVLFLSSLLVATYDTKIAGFQHLINYSVDANNFLYIFGLDGISIYFFFLSCFLIFLCLLFLWEDSNFKEYAINLLLIELFLLIIFSALDLFIFYVFFEAVLIPMFLIIGVWGSRERKIRAVYLFFFYTLCGSVLMLISILYIYAEVGTLNLEYLMV